MILTLLSSLMGLRALVQDNHDFIVLAQVLVYDGFLLTNTDK